MLGTATARQVALGVSSGIVIGGAVATPTVLHGLDPGHHHDGTSSGAARVAAGILGNVVLPAGLLIGSAAVHEEAPRHALQAAAAGVEMGWWGANSVTQLAA
jgi:hypothetical protein